MNTKVSIGEGTRCDKPPKVPKATLEAREGFGSATASSPGKATKLSHLGFTGKPGHKCITTLRTLIRILTSQTRNLITYCDCVEEANLYNIQYSLQVSLHYYYCHYNFFFFFFLVSDHFLCYCCFFRFFLTLSKPISFIGESTIVLPKP